MYYTEMKTKNGKLGALIIDETVEGIVASANRWVDENKIRLMDLTKAVVKDKESDEELGELEYNTGAIKFDCLY